MTYYYPNCWTTLNKKEQTCPECGYEIKEFQELEYEDKLLAALHHSVPERRIMAAQILGNLESQRALPEFLKIIESGEEDYFFLRSVLLAIAKINCPDLIIILKKATDHKSTLVSHLARELLDLVSEHRIPKKWDSHTG